MSTQTNLPNNKKEALHQLSTLQKQSENAINAKDATLAIRSMGNYFEVMWHCSSQKLIDADLFKAALSTWVNNINRLFKLTVNAALEVSVNAAYLCQVKKDDSDCGKLIANTVFNYINILAHPAHQEYIKKKWQSNRPQAESADIGPYLAVLLDVMKSTVRHYDSPDILSTYKDARVQLRTMLFSSHVPPVKRLEYVQQVFEWAKANQGFETLARDMNEWLGWATVLPNGQKILQHPLEIQADQLAREAIAAKKKEPVDIKRVFAIRAEIPQRYSRLFHRIENAFEQSDFMRVEYALCGLFHELGGRAVRHHEAIQADIPVYSYFLKSASKLFKLSPERGFELAEKCIYAIEERSFFSEPLMNVVYGFALPVVSTLAGQDLYTGHAKEMFKIIMRRSAEFKTSNNAEDIFECAARSFRIYLGSISPVDRYVEVEELSFWLGSREIESPLLAEFVDDLMNSALNYGNNMGIPLEEDETEPSESAEIRSFPLHAMKSPLPT